MEFGLDLFRARPERAGKWHDRLSDPLLVTCAIVLLVALAGIALTMAAAVLALVTLLATAAPAGHPFTDPAWDPVGSIILALVALSIIAGGIGNILAIMGTVADRNAFEPANAGRIERLGWRVVELFAVGWIARWLHIPVGGTINGFDISVDLGGGNALAFALILFVLARVFRQGNRMREDLEGTV